MITSDLPLFNPIPPELKLEPTRFDIWIHTDHGREIARAVIRLAMALKNSGFKKFGIGAIVERIRWNMAVKNRDENGFKISNSYRAGLSRFAVDRRPELKDFFMMKEQKNSDLMPLTVLRENQTKEG